MQQVLLQLKVVLGEIEEKIIKMSTEQTDNIDNTHDIAFSGTTAATGL